MSTVDDVFSGRGKEAPPEVLDRTPRIALLLGVAGLLCAFGVTCFTGVPGAALTIWCWQLCEEELHRVETGVLPRDRGPAIRRLKLFASILLGFSAVSLIVQIFLFANGTYQLALDLLLELVGFGSAL
ncbi:MAG: hypothetical protein ACOZNI_15650 [Myxococcota bacterium]